MKRPAIMRRFSSLARAQTLFLSEKRTGMLYRKPFISFQSPPVDQCEKYLTWL
jgi:hypothetical protein